MAKKPKRPARANSANGKKAAITLERAARMYRLIQLLRESPRTRKALLQRLRLDMRSFYRDLDTLRKAGVQVHLNGSRYHLSGRAEDAVALLPFPDPRLTLGHARLLAKGRTRAHKLLKQQIAAILG